MCRATVPPFPLLDRIAIRDYGGYVPIGFFQMWHGSLGRRYPIAKGRRRAHRRPARDPVGREPRHLIPEVVAVHLQSDSAPLGANWKGRTTPRFAPGTDPIPYVRRRCPGPAPATTPPGSTWAEPPCPGGFGVPAPSRLCVKRSQVRPGPDLPPPRPDRGGQVSPGGQGDVTDVVAVERGPAVGFDRVEGRRPVRQQRVPPRGIAGPGAPFVVPTTRRCSASNSEALLPSR